MRKFIKWLCVVGGLWTALVLFIFSADAANKWNIGRWPVVLAKASDLHTKTYQGKYGPYTLVLGTIDFDRPDGSNTIHCRIKDFVLGSDGQEKAYAATFELAVHPSSCGGVARLPLESSGSSLRDLLFAEFVGLIASAVGILAHFNSTSARRRELSNDRAQ